MNPNPQVYTLQTWNGHFGSLRSIMFYLKLAREQHFYCLVAVAIIVVFCRLQSKFRNTQSLATDYRDPSRYVLVHALLTLSVSDFDFEH